MFLGFLKRTVAQTETRDARTRASDRFERHLRVALRERDLVIHGPATLRNLLALIVPAGSTQGRTERLTSLQVDFTVLDERSRTPVLGVILTTRTYGRDRRARPELPIITAGPHTLTPVVHLNPNLLPDVLTIRTVLQPYLPD